MHLMSYTYDIWPYLKYRLVKVLLINKENDVIHGFCSYLYISFIIIIDKVRCLAYAWESSSHVH